jgi:hypothetical protein
MIKLFVNVVFVLGVAIASVLLFDSMTPESARHIQLTPDMIKH